MTTTWHLIAVDGPERDLRAFVAGFLADRKAPPSSVAVGDDVGLATASGSRAPVDDGRHALLVPDHLAGALERALAHAGAGLRVAESHSVASASFEMRAHVDTRAVSARLRAALRGAPMSQHSESEEARAEVNESSGPVHTYVYRVRATVNGPVGDVLAVRGDLADIDAATLGPLHLA